MKGYRIQPQQRTTEEILADFREVESALSPENLFQDGEISQARAKVKSFKLRCRRDVLVRELGREPNLNEIYGNCY